VLPIVATETGGAFESTFNAVSGFFIQVGLVGLVQAIFVMPGRFIAYDDPDEQGSSAPQYIAMGPPVAIALSVSILYPEWQPLPAFVSFIVS